MLAGGDDEDDDDGDFAEAEVEGNLMSDPAPTPTANVMQRATSGNAISFHHLRLVEVGA